MKQQKQSLFDVYEINGLTGIDQAVCLLHQCCDLVRHGIVERRDME